MSNSRVRFNVFRIQDERVICDSTVPAIFTRLARATFGPLFDACIFDINRIEQMVGVSLAILASAEAGTYYREPYYRDDDSEAEKINDVLCLLDDGKHHWQTMLPEGVTLRPSDMLAAYALYQLDKAATSHIAGDHESELEQITLAYEAVASGEFHYGYWAKTSDHRVTGKLGARASKVAQASDVLRDYSIKRFRDGNPNGQPWKSPRECAVKIESDVVAESKRIGQPLTGQDVWRTIYRWFNDAGLTKKDPK